MEERSADPILQGRGSASGKSSGAIKVTVQPGSHRIKLRIWSSALEVKQQMREVNPVPVSWMRLLHNNVELLNSERLIDLVPTVKRGGRGSSDGSRDRGGSSRTLTFWLKVQNPHDFDSGCYLHPWGIGTNAAGAAGERLLANAQQGLQIGLAPQLLLEGSGGTYVLRDTRRNKIAAFKPRDEEPFAPNNPRGLAGKMGQAGIHPHVASGDAHIREVLAFRLDWGGFASVPCTLQVEGRHPALHVNSLQPLSRYGAKVGSLQAWVPHDDTASDRGTATFPVHQVHKIAILDMRLLNTDRHDSNMLVVDKEEAEGGLQLVPIDHGGCLPAAPEVSWFNWCWLSWPQMKVPLSASDAAYVASLDVAAEARLLTELGVPPRSRRVCYCSTLMLQRGVAAGLSLLEVASLMCREEEEVPSELERLWTQAERLAYSALHNHRLRGGHLDAYASSPNLAAAAEAAEQPPPPPEQQKQKEHAAARPATVPSAAVPSSPTAAPAAASSPTAATAATAATAEEGEGGSSRSNSRCCSPPLPRRTVSGDPFLMAGHRRTGSGDLGSPSLRKPLPPASPSKASAFPAAADSPPATPTAKRALTGIKRVISTSTLVDFASYHALGSPDGDAGGAAHAEEPGGGGGWGRRLSAASQDPGGAAEATFLAYFERMLDDMVERHVSRRRGAETRPAAPPEAKSPRTSQSPLDTEGFDAPVSFEAEVP